jgi:hypothetical protein
MITFSRSQICISVILALYLFQFIGNITEFDPIKPSVIISTIGNWISSIVQPVSDFIFSAISIICTFIWHSLIEMYKLFVQPLVDLFLSLVKACYNLLPGSIITFLHETSWDMLITYFMILLGVAVVVCAFVAVLDLICNHPN